MFVRLIGYVLHENIFPTDLNVKRHQKNRHRSTAALIHYQTYDI